MFFSNKMQGMQSNGTLSAPGFAQMEPSHKALRPQANRVGVICTKISARRRVLVRHRASTVCSAAVASYQLAGRQAGRSSSSRRRSSRRGEKGAERRFAAVLASICTTTNANKQAIRYVEIVALT